MTMMSDDQLPDPVSDDAPDPEQVGETVRRPGRALWDVVAVSYDGRVLCRQCASTQYLTLCRTEPERIPHGGPIDRGTEWDCPGPVCDHCRRRIESVSVLHGECDPTACPLEDSP